MTLSLVRNLPYTHPHRWDGSLFGYPKLWRPNQLGSALALWLDAEDASTITLNGSTVSQWADKSGNGRNLTQTEAARQPTYQATGFNGKPALSLDGGGDCFTDATLPCPANKFSFFFVLNANLTGAYHSLFDKLALPYNMAWIRSTGLLEINASALVSTNVVTGANNIVSLIERSSPDPTLSTWLNGADNGTSNAVTTISNPLDLNVFNRAGGQTFSGKIAEIVYASDDVGSENRQRIEGYLAWKWLLEGSLPANHPYKNVPPTV